MDRQEELKQAEMSVLGSILLDPASLDQISDKLMPQHFADESMGFVYKLLVSMRGHGEAIDLVTLSTQLEAEKKLKKVGGRTFLTDCVSATPTSHHIEEYSISIMKAAKRRSLSKAAQDIVAIAMDDTIDVDEATEKAKTALMHDDFELHKSDPIADYKEFKDEFSDISQGDVMGLKTGIRKLDMATLGLVRNHIWVCGAYYGYGKTYFALNLINSVLEQDKKVLFFSLEMTSAEIIQRLIAMRAGMSLVEVIGQVAASKKDRRDQAEREVLEWIEQGKFIIDDLARTTDALIARIIAEDLRGHVDFVALDYIQLLGGDDQYEMLRDATKRIQEVTKRVHTTTLLLSQINNAAQKAGNSSPVDGFKGAGDIGQIANVALKVVRERDSETGEFDPLFGLRLTKIRHGKPCSIMCDIKFPGGRIAEVNDFPSVKPVKVDANNLFN